MKKDDMYCTTDKFSIYRVYGSYGLKQLASFKLSTCMRSNNVIFSFNCCDCTGTYDYVDVVLLYHNNDEARKEFYAQISDGFFRKCNIGKIELKAGIDLGNVY